MEVISSYGCHVGVVDRVEGERIKLTKDDPEASGSSLHPDGLGRARRRQVHLNTDAEETRREWEEAGGTQSTLMIFQRDPQFHRFRRFEIWNLLKSAMNSARRNAIRFFVRVWGLAERTSRRSSWIKSFFTSTLFANLDMPAFVQQYALHFASVNCGTTLAFESRTSIFTGAPASKRFLPLAGGERNRNGLARRPRKRRAPEGQHTVDGEIQTCTIWVLAKWSTT